jgi:hypothetical protein
MNKHIERRVTIFVLAACLVIGLIACATTPNNGTYVPAQVRAIQEARAQKIFKTLKALKATYTEALPWATELRLKGVLDDQAWTNVKDTFRRFDPCYQAAVDALDVFRKAPSDDNYSFYLAEAAAVSGIILDITNKVVIPYLEEHQ